MGTQYFKIENLEIITDEESYNFAQNFIKNSNITYLKIFDSLRSLNNKLTTNDFKSILINSKLLYNTNIAEAESINALTLNPNKINLNTSETSSYNYTIAVASPTQLISVYTIEGSNTLSYIPYITGTARACVNGVSLTYTGQTNNTYNYNVNLTIQVEADYKYKSRMKLYVKFIFITSFGYMQKNLIINLVQE